jgi:transcriptional regulator of acetoin/glycerol metabolism
VGTSKTSGGRVSARLSSSSLRAVHELFVAGQLDLDSTPLRRVVAESWRRSLATGVDPDLGGPQQAAIVALDRMRASHPLAPALPVIRRLLVNDASDAGVVVAVTAADGTLLWVEGDLKACRKAERMNFVPGADWSERGAGTNAPGTARPSMPSCRSVEPSTSPGSSSSGVAPRCRYTTPPPGRSSAPSI